MEVSKIDITPNTLVHSWIILILKHTSYFVGPSFGSSFQKPAPFGGTKGATSTPSPFGASSIQSSSTPVPAPFGNQPTQPSVFGSSGGFSGTTSNISSAGPFSGSASSSTPFGGQAPSQKPQRFLGKSPKELLTTFYREKNPSKVHEVDKLLTKYAGNEEKLFQNLAAKYQLNPSVFGVGSALTPVQGFGQTSPLTGTISGGFGAISSSSTSPFGASSTPGMRGFGATASAASHQSTPFGSSPNTKPATSPFSAHATNTSAFGSFASTPSSSGGGFGGFGGGASGFGANADANTNTSPFGGPRR